MKNQKIRSMKVHEQSGYNYKANIIDNSKTTYDMFKRVKQFYKRLKIEQHRNGQM